MDAYEEMIASQLGDEPTEKDLNIISVLSMYPDAHIIAGDGTNPPDIAVIKGGNQDGGLLSKFCWTEDAAWQDAANKVRGE